MAIAAPHYKEMPIAFAQFHVTQPFNSKNRNLPRLTKHPFSYPSTLRFLKYHLLLISIPLSFNPLPTAKKAFPNPLVIAYRRNASLHDLLVHTTLQNENPSSQQPAEIKKCNHPQCLTYSFLQGGQTNYTFFYNETRKITHSIFCYSKNLIYLIECKKCHLPYIGENKHQINNALGSTNILS